MDANMGRDAAESYPAIHRGGTGVLPEIEKRRAAGSGHNNPEANGPDPAAQFHAGM